MFFIQKRFKGSIKKIVFDYKSILDLLDNGLEKLWIENNVNQRISPVKVKISITKNRYGGYITLASVWAKESFCGHVMYNKSFLTKEVFTYSNFRDSDGYSIRITYLKRKNPNVKIYLNGQLKNE